MPAHLRVGQSSGSLGPVVHSRAHSVTADLAICYGCQYPAWFNSCHFWVTVQTLQGLHHSVR